MLGTVTRYVRPSCMPKYVPDANCVLWLPGQDDPQSSTIRDRSGQGNDGTIAGGATWTKLASGLWALRLDGTDGQVQIADTGLLDGISTLTIELWVIFHATTTWGGLMLSRGTRTQGWLQNDGGKVVFRVDDGTNSTILTSDQSIVLEKEYHLVGTWDGTTALMYINATLEPAATTGDGASGAIAQNDYFYVGWDDFDAARHSNITVALERIHTATLSATQVAGHYQQERHLFGV